MIKKKKHINILRKALWKKIFDTDQITPTPKACDAIQKAIYGNTGYRLNRDTIRNFLNGRHKPAPQTLDIYSTFLLGGNMDQPKTFRDFINSLSSEKPRNNSVNKQRILKWSILIILLLLIFSMIQCDHLLDLSPEDKNTTFFDRFENSNIKDLNKMGWHLYEDSINLEVWNPKKYQNSGFLTMETHLGDSHLNNIDYQPKIANILRKPLDCGPCCNIRVKIVDFNPFQCYQQAGLFLFFDQLPYPSLRMGFGYDARVGVFIRNGEYSNRLLYDPLKKQAIHNIHNGKVVNPIDSIVMAIKVNKAQYIFSYKKNNEAWVVLSDWNSNFPPPLYLGLYACQGRPDIPSPVRPVAPVISVHFEYVSVQSCAVSK